MRRFVVIGHDAPTSADFSLDDLPGAGRFDVLCRCVSSALLTSHGVREDTSVWLVLADTVTIRVDGDPVRNLSPDERSIAGLLRSALGDAERAVGAQWVESSPGVSVASLGLSEALRAGPSGPVFQLHENGEVANAGEMPVTATFVLSDHRDPTDDEQALLDEHVDGRLSVGPTALHADQAIVIVHHLLDTAEERPA